MTPNARPNSKRNLDAAIARVAKGGVSAQQTRIVIANTVVGQMLPEGAIKGGSALKLRYGNETTRFTRDLDTARKRNLEDFIAEFRERLSLGWNGFTGTVVRREPPQPKGVPEKYVMLPFEIKLAYNQKSWITVPLEIGHNEIGDADEPEYGIASDISELFVELGFPAPEPVALMALHHQIAQKLHAVSGEGSERAHDLVDLQVIYLSSEIDFRKTKETCVRLFEYRGLQCWPPRIQKGENWESIYESQMEGLSVADSIDAAIEWTNDLIVRIDSF